MRAIVKLLAALLLIATGCGDVAPAPGSIPQDYYNCSCQQPEGTTLHEWLANLPFYGEVDLSGGGWDCSQMSAYVEWLVTNCGYSVVITCRKATDMTPGHTWLTIEGNPYEATGLYWIDLDTANPYYYTAHVWLGDIYEAVEHTKKEQVSVTPLGEWGWWITYPELYKE